MAGGVGEGDHAAERCAKDDRSDDAEVVAKRAHVIAPLRQVPALARSVLAAPVAAMIEIDDLRGIGQRRVGRTIDGVIGTRTSVQHQQIIAKHKHPAVHR